VEDEKDGEDEDEDEGWYMVRGTSRIPDLEA